MKFDSVRGEAKKIIALAAIVFAGCSGSSGSSAFAPSASAASTATTTTTTTPTTTTTTTTGGGTPSLTPTPSPSHSPATTRSMIPARPAGAESGREFLDRTKSLPRIGAGSREEAIEAEIARGNVPDFCRVFHDVHLAIPGHTAIVRVAADYLAIGSNADHVRMPMGAKTAERLAQRFGCVLPTKPLVDAIWKQATVKLTPHPLPAGPRMMSNDYYRQHADAVDAQLAGKPLGELTAGHKKDVICSALIAQHPGKVIIYGWHEPNGKPIQPRSWIHEITYADYSHGIRLVESVMLVDGKPWSVDDVLKDPALCRLLSDEGPIANPNYPTR